MNSMNSVKTISLICAAIATLFYCITVIVNSVSETGVYSIEAWIVCGVTAIIFGICSGLAFKDERIALCGAGAFAFLSAGVGLLFFLLSAQNSNPEIAESTASNAAEITTALTLFI